MEKDGHFCGKMLGCCLKLLPSRCTAKSSDKKRAMTQLKRKMTASKGIDFKGKVRGQYDKILVLELERLLACYDTQKKYQSTSRVELQKSQLRDIITVRSDWPDFFESVQDHFFIVLWSTLTREDSAELMAEVDPDDRISYKLFAEDCEKRSFGTGPPILVKTCEALGGRTSYSST